MGRNKTIDIAKAICIIFVVIGHYLPDDSPQWYQAIHNIIYSFHMPLFLFASGYIYISTFKECSYGSFILKKVKRLMIPYFSTSVIVISIKLLTQAFSGAQIDNPVDVYSFLRMFYLPEAGYFLWFVWALWWMFVLTPLFKTKAQRNVLFALILVCTYLPFETTDIFCITEFKRMYVYFLLGIFVYENNLAKYIDKISSVVICIVFVALEALFVLGFYSEVFSLLLPYLGIAAVLFMSRNLVYSKMKKFTALLLAVATSSYIIYLFHTTFEGFVKSSLRIFPSLVDVTNDVAFGIGALIVILVGVVGPVLLHKYILNKNKILKYLFGLK